MKHPFSFRRFAFFALFGALALLPAAAAGPFRLALLQQTKEPPLFGSPAPPSPKIEYPQKPYYQGQPPLYQPLPQPQPQPVPVVPGPPLPQAFQQPAPPAFQQPLPQPFPPPPAFNQLSPSPVAGTPCPLGDPPTPLVTLKVRVAPCGTEGQEIEYRIRVENCSPAPAHHVLVRNPLPVNARMVRAQPEPAVKDSELVWIFGTLAPGACRDICLVLRSTDDNDVKNCCRVQFEHGQCVSTRIAKASPGAYPELPPKEPPIVVPPKEKPKEPIVVVPPKEKAKDPPKVFTGDGKLSLKITGPKQQYANLPATYQISVTNTGDDVAENVLVSALLPENAVPVQASDKGRTQFGVVAWLIGNLPVKGSRTVQMTFRVPVGGDFCVKATAQSEAGSRGETESCTTFEGVSGLAVEVLQTKNPVAVGEETSYKITLTNQGTASMTNLLIKAQVPPELAALKATGPTNPPDKLPPAGADGQTVLFAPLKELKAGEKLTYEVFAKALRAGDARIRVTLTADQLQAGGPVIEEQSTNVFREDDPFRPMPGPPGLETRWTRRR